MTARGPGEVAVHAKASVHQSTLPRLARHGGASISARTRRKSFESKILLTTCVRAGQEGSTIVFCSLRMTTHGGGVQGLYGLAAGCDFGVTQRW
jgi:hypothetical protein